eukprot:CAMPEP_0174276650 /NCGR_PEP_ID=MMETSP0439-20130205/60508_1 /TAXON_ID=0 /ORGANISM="Stereomyxa ramosa, Strain Chinc5" /LENGTH=228 /DNA_ID=CAMNT_0015368907 /DNA_START=877 /DNA_END=1560 /DNA_ORIENTATION=+
MVIVRAEVRTIHYDQRNVLYGFMHAGIPSINSWKSILLSCERPVVHGELLGIQHQVGKEEFPVVSQYYYSSGSDMGISPGTKPMVLKLGPWHAGIGKSYLKDHHDFEEMRSLVEAGNYYATCELFIPYVYDLRVQYVNGSIKAFRRRGCGWKSNTSSGVDVQEVPITKKIKRWVELTKGIFGGLDIFSLDVLHTSELTEEEREQREEEGEEEEGEDHILELNDTSSGW